MRSKLIMFKITLLLLTVAFANPACLEKPDPGRCKAYVPSWYFDKTSMKCKKFIYGGCGGTIPFRSLALCKRASCERNKCLSRPDPGRCEAAIEKWFFNWKSGACEIFYYGGCGGNVPFNTKQECRSARCNIACTKIPDKGYCKGDITRWFYDNKTNKCKPFSWGGCGGSVPFKTLKQCQNAQCLPSSSPKPNPTPIPWKERCHVKGVRGPCKANFRRWNWDKKTGSCKPFSYGGCFGVVPFKTEAQCRKARCGKPKCFILKFEVIPPKNAITCQAFWTSWYYNRRNGKCESFSYSGCSEAGPFKSKEECTRARCAVKLCAFRKPSLTPGCKIGSVSTTTWYFDLDTRKCRKTIGDKCERGQVFSTFKECKMAKCHTRLCEMRVSDVTAQKSDTVVNPPDKSWYFSKTKQKCLPFLYSGGAKRLPFKWKKECEQKCLQA